MNGFRPIILIPSYNTGGALLERTVRGAMAEYPELMVVLDGSTDDSETHLRRLEREFPSLRVLRRPQNGGKGAAVRDGVDAALAEGFSHALTMDADGQHPADRIHLLLEAARTHPQALIMGQPIFGPDAPLARLKGRKLTIWWTDLETLHCGLGDTLFGMRVYPLAPLACVFRHTPFARGFDFDPEAAVRLCWMGCQPVQVPVPVRYLSREEGGVSQFRYLRDNVKLTFLHFRLVPELLFRRLPAMRRHLRNWNNPP